MSEDKSIRKAQEVIHKVAETIKKNGLMVCIAEGIAEEWKEEAGGITAQQIIDLIREYLKQKGAEQDAGVFLTLLANFPKSMVARNLTPLAKIMIAATYWTEEVSMEDLARWFNRSKSTISEAIEKLEGAEALREAREEMQREWKNLKEDEGKKASEEKF